MPVVRIIIVKDGKSAIVDLLKKEVLHQSHEQFTGEELDALLRPLLKEFFRLEDKAEEKSDAASSS